MNFQFFPTSLLYRSLSASCDVVVLPFPKSCQNPCIFLPQGAEYCRCLSRLHYQKTHHLKSHHMGPKIIKHNKKKLVYGRVTYKCISSKGCRSLTVLNPYGKQTKMLSGSSSDIQITAVGFLCTCIPGVTASRKIKLL